MTQPTERQHYAADQRLRIALTLGANPTEPTKDIATFFLVSQRTVQSVRKAWQEDRYRSLYNINVVETDKIINGKHCGVTKYTWEGKNE